MTPCWANCVNKPSSEDTAGAWARRAAALIGHRLPPFTVQVEAGRLRFFAKATGQQDPVYWDVAAGRRAGHPDLPVPPTFLFCLELEAPDPAAFRNLVSLDYRNVLHGEQHFDYHAMAFAGDALTFDQRIEDMYEKKGSALRFVERRTRVMNQHEVLIAELNCVLVSRIQIRVEEIG